MIRSGGSGMNAADATEATLAHPTADSLEGPAGVHEQTQVAFLAADAPEGGAEGSADHTAGATARSGSSGAAADAPEAILVLPAGDSLEGPAGTHHPTAVAVGSVLVGDPGVG